MLKRFFDILFSLSILIIFSPLLFYIALAIKRESSGHVFYKGRRVGKGGKIFYMNKFRTMVANADKIGGPTTSNDDARITRVGKILRRYKLDELPQFINVLKGEMSIVGPRPDVEDVIKLIPEEQKKPILSLRPGITDFASLYFRNEGEIVNKSTDPHKAYLEKIWPKKIELQLKYAKEQSFFTDIKIIAKTIAVLCT